MHKIRIVSPSVDPKYYVDHDPQADTPPSAAYLFVAWIFEQQHEIHQQLFDVSFLKNPATIRIISIPTESRIHVE